ncbi:FTR1 family protein [Streptomyces lasiicapitis]|uniref:FTR1 family iron permease n=1 Tax=Streptomyces lasiicapitis TaxID=1923961 RepID=UPI00331E2248
MFDTFLIGLRGGLAAAVLVGVLAAHLVRSGRRGSLRAVGGGAGAAVAMALGFGCALTFGSQELTFKAREAYGGWLSLAAVVLVTWVVAGMVREAQAQPPGESAPAARQHASVPAAAAFFVVGSCGVETALFFWGTVRASGDGTHAPLAGAVLGLLMAVALGWLCARGLVRAGQAAFPRWAGTTTAVVTAGVLANGVRHLQEAELLGGLQAKAYDIAATFPPDSWYVVLLDAAFGFRLSPTVTQIVVWALYLMAVLALLFVPSRGRPRLAGARRRAPFGPR